MLSFGCIFLFTVYVHTHVYIYVIYVYRYLIVDLGFMLLLLVSFVLLTYIIFISDNYFHWFIQHGGRCNILNVGNSYVILIVDYCHFGI